LVGSANDLKPESLIELRRTANPRRMNNPDYYPIAELQKRLGGGLKAQGRMGT
jgi:hypothetical protein